MPRGVSVGAGFVLLLTLINGVKQIRATGIAQWNLDLSVFSPFAALEELGSSIRVVAYVVAWHGQNGEPLRNGDTYTVAIVRFVEKIISPGSRPPAVSDFRLMNSEIAARSGNIGGSMIGEAYHNFGSIGAPIVLLVVGAVFAFFENRRFSSVRLALYAVFAVPLFNHVRNSFVPVVPVVIFGPVVVLGVVIVARSRRHTGVSV